MIKRFLNIQTKSVGTTAIILGIFGLTNSFLALFRDRFLAARFGAGSELDVYFPAFRIPDFIYGVLIAGGIISVFLPVFSEYFNKGEKEGWRFANLVLSSFFILLLAICSLLFIFAPFVLRIIVPGFSGEKFQTVVGLTRIMLLSPMFFVLSSVLSGILHYFHRFLAYSLAPILYNLGIIFGILFLTKFFGVYGLAYGVILGAFAYFLIQFVSLVLAGFRFVPIFNFKDPGLIRIYILSLPRSIGSMVSDFNLFFITGIASTFVAGSLAVLNFSRNIQTFPISLIGVSFATAAFPILAKTWARGDRPHFIERFSFVLRHILFLIVPVSFMFFILRAQIVRVILGSGQFGWRDTQLTAACLGISALAVLASSIITLLLRAFYSIQDTKTPVAIAIVSVLFNISCAYLFVHLLSFDNSFKNMIAGFLKIQKIDNIQVVGLALALALSSLLQLVLLFVFLHKKIGDLKIREILDSFGKIFIASVLMGLFAYLALQVSADYTDMRHFIGVFVQTLSASAVGGLVYLFVTYMLKSPEIKSVWSLLLRFKNNNGTN